MNPKAAFAAWCVVLWLFAGLFWYGGTVGFAAPNDRAQSLSLASLLTFGAFLLSVGTWALWRKEEER